MSREERQIEQFEQQVLQQQQHRVVAARAEKKVDSQLAAVSTTVEGGRL